MQTLIVADRIARRRRWRVSIATSKVTNDHERLGDHCDGCVFRPWNAVQPHQGTREDAGGQTLITRGVFWNARAKKGSSCKCARRGCPDRPTAAFPGGTGRSRDGVDRAGVRDKSDKATTLGRGREAQEALTASPSPVTATTPGRPHRRTRRLVQHPRAAVPRALHRRRRSPIRNRRLARLARPMSAATRPTLAAYGRDLAAFLVFLTDHLGRAPSLTDLDAMAPTSFACPIGWAPHLARACWRYCATSSAFSSGAAWDQGQAERGEARLCR
jgi:hypothetical protein